MSCQRAGATFDALDQATKDLLTELAQDSTGPGQHRKHRMAGRPPTQTPPQEGKQILMHSIWQKNKKIHNNQWQTKPSTQYRDRENRPRKQQRNTLLLPPGQRWVHPVQTPKSISSKIRGNSNSVTHHQNEGHYSHNAPSICNPERKHSK